MITLFQLAKRLRTRQREADAKLVAGVRRAVVVGATAAVKGTPVDTGQSRSNWRISSKLVPVVHEPFRPLTPSQTAQERARKYTERANANAAIAECKAGLAAITDAQILKGTEINLQNHHEVAVGLERGTLHPGSLQNSPGFVYDAALASRVSLKTGKGEPDA